MQQIQHGTYRRTSFGKAAEGQCISHGWDILRQLHQTFTSTSTSKMYLKPKEKISTLRKVFIKKEAELKRQREATYLLSHKESMMMLAKKAPFFLQFLSIYQTGIGLPLMMMLYFSFLNQDKKNPKPQTTCWKKLSRMLKRLHFKEIRGC